MIWKFLSESGTRLKGDPKDFGVDQKEVLKGMDIEATKKRPTIRYTHATQYTTIVRYALSDNAVFLNQFHRDLAVANGKSDIIGAEFLLQIVRE